jgi:hypothetical protein
VAVVLKVLATDFHRALELPVDDGEAMRDELANDALAAQPLAQERKLAEPSAGLVARGAPTCIVTRSQ